MNSPPSRHCSTSKEKSSDAPTGTQTHRQGAVSVPSALSLPLRARLPAPGALEPVDELPVGKKTRNRNISLASRTDETASDQTPSSSSQYESGHHDLLSDISGPCGNLKRLTESQVSHLPSLYTFTMQRWLCCEAATEPWSPVHLSNFAASDNMGAQTRPQRQSAPEEDR